MPTKPLSANSVFWMRVFAAVLIVLGIVTIGMSFIWFGRAAQRTSWSDAQAAQYQEASIRLHSLSHQIANSRPGRQATVRAELAQAKSEYEQLRQALENALEYPRRLSWIMRILGFLIVLAGGVMMFMLPSKDQLDSNQS